MCTAQAHVRILAENPNILLSHSLMQWLVQRDRLDTWLPSSLLSSRTCRSIFSRAFLSLSTWASKHSIFFTISWLLGMPAVLREVFPENSENLEVATLVPLILLMPEAELHAVSGRLELQTESGRLDELLRTVLFAVRLVTCDLDVLGATLGAACPCFALIEYPPDGSISVANGAL